MTRGRHRLLRWLRRIIGTPLPPSFPPVNTHICPEFSFLRKSYPSGVCGCGHPAIFCMRTIIFEATGVRMSIFAWG